MKNVRTIKWNLKEDTGLISKETDKIKVFALGGVGEVGKNMYVLETENKIFIVDVGLMIPAEEMLGIDMVIPDVSYLVEKKDKVQGVFLTHGHDEHIGGLPYVLRKLKVPVYGTKFTLALVKEELGDSELNVNLIEIDHNTTLSFQEIDITFFRTTHSIPDSIGVIFHTDQGAIVHTGDYKFDPTSVGLFGCDIDKMAQIGNKGVLCLLSDSINAEKIGYSGSEYEVGQEIRDAFYQAEGRIIVVTYAKNIQRIQYIMQAAKDAKRKVAFVGEKLTKIIEIAQSLDYLFVPEQSVIPFNEMSKIAEHEKVIIASSQQGEPISTLSELAQGTHKHIKLMHGDTVVIAAAPTPATEIKISKSVDLLFRAGCHVVYGNEKIHVTGHGNKEDIKLMLNLMKPKYLLPVHGEYRMQKAQSKIAQSIGMAPEDIFLLEKGEVIEFAHQKASYSSKIPVGNVLIDGLGVGDVGNIVLRDRRLLSQDGILIIVVTLSKKRNVLVSEPKIISKGFVYVKESEKLLVEITNLVNEIMIKCIQDRVVDWSSLKINIRDSLNQFLYERTKRRPMILPIIMEA